MRTLNANIITALTGGASVFNPSSIKDADGNLLLSQQLLVKQSPTLTGLITDESKNKGDARPEQLRQFRNLNGTTQYGIVADNTDLDITNNLSVVVWAKNDEATISDREVLLGRYDASLDFREWRLVVEPGQQVRLDFGDPTNGLFVGSWISTDTITTNSVNTIGFTFASGTLIVYINGVAITGTEEFGTIPSTLLNSPADLTIGTSNALAATSLWDGDIYELRIYDTTVLTASEMLDIHNRPTSHAPVGARNVAHYKLDNNGSEIIYDSSGNGNDGAWVNAPTKSTGGAVHSWANEVGFTQRMFFDGVEDNIDVGTRLLPLTGDWKLSYKIQLPTGYTSGANRFAVSQHITGNSGRLAVGVNTEGNSFVFLGGDTVTGVALNDGNVHKMAVTRVGNTFTLYVDDVSQGTITFSGSLSDTNTGIGIIQDISRYFIGSFWDLEFDIGNNGTLNHRYLGYGNTNADWVDQIGSANGTVVGTPSNIFFPRNEAIPTQDVLGQALQFTGRVPYNARLTQSNAITLNGTSQYVTVSGMTATANYFGACTISAEINVNSVASPSAIWSLGASAYRLYINTTWFLNSATNTGVTATTGTHRVSVTYNSAGEAISFSLNGVVVWTGTAPVGIDPTTTFLIGARDLTGTPGLFFPGQVYNFSLTGSSVKNFSFNGAEGGGRLLYDKSGENNHGMLVNAPTVTKQDRFHSNFTEGFNKYLYLSGNTGGVRLPVEYQALVEGKGRIDFEYDVILQENPEVTGSVHTIPIRGTPSPLIGFETTITAEGRPGVGGRSLSTETYRSMMHSQSIPLNVKTRVRVYIDYTNQEGGISIGGGAYETAELEFITPTFTRLNTSTCTFGSRYESGTRLRAIISNCKLHSNGDLLAEYDGYGNTNADWVATFGGSSINGTVLGSPSNIYIPALNSTTAVTGEPLRNPAGAYHNGAETLIDFTNGVLSPEAVQNSWEDDWAFNDARTNPKFKRTLTSSSVDVRADRFLAYREELTGSNLTKVNKYVETKEV